MSFVIFTKYNFEGLIYDLNQDITGMYVAQTDLAALIGIRRYCRRNRLQLNCFTV